MISVMSQRERRDCRAGWRPTGKLLRFLPHSRKYLRSCPCGGGSFHHSLKQATSLCMLPQTWFGRGKGVLHHSAYKPGTRLVPFLLPAAGGHRLLAYNANVFMAVKLGFWDMEHLPFAAGYLSTVLCTCSSLMVNATQLSQALEIAQVHGLNF